MFAMMTSSNGNIFRAIGHLCGEFRTRSFGVFFDLRLNKRLSKQSWGWWFDTQSRPLWRHSNGCIFWGRYWTLLTILRLLIALFRIYHLGDYEQVCRDNTKMMNFTSQCWVLLIHTQVASNEHGGSNHRQFDCLFNSFFWQTTKEH